ncbi:MAG TPA: hypothetical protein VIB39_22295 [Candidatus Angelobacter sp.]|jgi:hypothetical protein
MRQVRINAVRSDVTVIAVQAGSQRHKLFNVVFGKDGSLYVGLPYFSYQAGIVASATIPGNQKMTNDVNLQIGGKISSHLVKYSHHWSGTALFSQDGKVRSEIRRQSVPLTMLRGHIFSIIIQGLENFSLADPAKDRGLSKKRAVVNFALEDHKASGAIKIVGRWFDHHRLSFSQTSPNIVGPAIATVDSAGKTANGFILASPSVNAQHVLILNCYQIDSVSPKSSLMLFYGGFSPESVMSDTSKEAGFLTCLYPAEDAEELRQLLGSIDFAP